jgi:ACDE family multidrug resistance protein
LRTSMLRLGQTLGPVGFTVTADLVFSTTVVGYRVLLVVTGVTATLGGVGCYLFLSLWR